MSSASADDASFLTEEAERIINRAWVEYLRQSSSKRMEEGLDIIESLCIRLDNKTMPLTDKDFDAASFDKNKRVRHGDRQGRVHGMGLQSRLGKSKKISVDVEEKKKADISFCALVTNIQQTFYWRIAAMTDGLESSDTREISGDAQGITSAWNLNH
ncbi:LOW QUALITY PROTEIN: hypothetical protein CVT26_008258 [Gymnopilus dilepis]|uniref:Uncharacterized protein n=1 Tax=Gymnopilus dilepis TaxID=231916 RepID=A0A409XXC9_9AGAR|nr:LOW QUALITY PROTEIN: hypothetical protein CVT26_008258 [Gymnopilus dilepis]